MSKITTELPFKHHVTARHQADNARLRRSAEALIRSNRNVTTLGDNEAVRDLASEVGLAAYDLVCFDVRIQSRLATLICVPSRLWHRAGAMAMFFELKAAATALGHHVVLVPESFVRRQPRSDNANMLMAATDFEISPTDRMKILEFLVDNGGGTLLEVASLVRNDDPVGAVLHLVTVGALDIDLNAAIVPASEVRLAAIAA